MKRVTSQKRKQASSNVAFFGHNPKAAGMSFRKWLGFDGPGNHGVPTVNTPYELWNEYTVITTVREPLDRALSC